MRRVANVEPSSRLVGILFLASGASLAVHILFPFPLWISFLLAVSIAVGSFTILLRSGRVRGDALKPLVWCGLASGIAATAAYDLARWLYVESVSSSVSPFHAIPLFGVAIVGAEAPEWLHVLAGTSFHLVNGLSFAIAFTICLGDKGPLWGIGWALVLETFMLVLYPRWFRIPAVGEFTAMSLLGHVAYGATLGTVSRYLLRSRRWLR